MRSLAGSLVDGVLADAILIPPTVSPKNLPLFSEIHYPMTH